jgi:hypothetical protein
VIRVGFVPRKTSLANRGRASPRSIPCRLGDPGKLMVDHDVKRIVARPHAICEAWYENRPTKFAKALEMS